MASIILPSTPSESRPGRFGAYGGRYVPETLMAALLELDIGVVDQMIVELASELWVLLVKFGKHKFTRTKHLHDIARHVDVRHPVTDEMLTDDAELVMFCYSEANHQVFAALCVPGPQGGIKASYALKRGASDEH